MTRPLRCLHERLTRREEQDGASCPQIMGMPCDAPRQRRTARRKGGNPAFASGRCITWKVGEHPPGTIEECPGLLARFTRLAVPASTSH